MHLTLLTLFSSFFVYQGPRGLPGERGRSGPSGAAVSEHSDNWPNKEYMIKIAAARVASDCNDLLMSVHRVPVVMMVCLVLLVLL